MKVGRKGRREQRKGGGKEEEEVIKKSVTVIRSLEAVALFMVSVIYNLKILAWNFHIHIILLKYFVIIIFLSFTCLSF